MSIRSIPVLAAALGLAFAGSVQAQDDATYDASPGQVVVEAPPPSAPPGATVRATPVSYADLDLDSYAGAHTLLGRIDQAAVQVCQPEPDTLMNIQEVRDYRDCLGSAVDRAVFDLDAPTVTELYRYGD